MRYEIIGLHKEDAFYHDRYQIINLRGKFRKESESIKGYLSGYFTLEKDIKSKRWDCRAGEKIYFYAVELKKIGK